MKLRLQSVVVALLPLLSALCAAPALHLATGTAETLPSPQKPADIWSDCSGGKDPIHIEIVSIYPDPPKKGEAVSVHAGLRLEEEVTNGTVTVELKYGIIPMFYKVWPLCHIAEWNHRHCPLKKGPLDITFNTTVSQIWPNGHYTGKVVAVNQNKTELLCADLDFHM